MSTTTNHTPKFHPLLGIDLFHWKVEVYRGTIEIRHRTTGITQVIPIPYTPQSSDWWREQGANAVSAADRGL